MPRFTRTLDLHSQRLLMLAGIILGAAGASSAADPYSFTERWRSAHFTNKNGLPSNRILDFCETQDGTTWASAVSGLMSFTIPLPLFRQPMVIIPLVAGAVVIGSLIGWMAIRRRRHHAQLRESEARFQQLAGSIHGVFWLVDVRAKRIIYVSPAYEEVFGRPPDRLYDSSKVWDEAIIDEDRGAATQCCDATQQGLPFVVEYRIARPDGSVRWICDQGFPIRDERGEISRYAGIAEDITEQKLAEVALRASEAEIRAIVDTAVDGIITTDEEGLVRSFNPAAEKLFGYSREEVIGRNVRMLMPSPYQEAHDQYLNQYRITGEKRIIGIGREVQGRRKDGSTLPLHLAVGEIHMAERRMFVGQLHDLTRRTTAEQALQRAHDELEARVIERTAELTQTNRTLRAEKAALRENRARLAEAQRIARLGHWDYDVQADEIVWSDEVYRIFGLKPQEFGATNKTFLDAVHPDDRQAVRGAIDQALYHQAPYSIEHRVLRPDGTEVIVHERAEVTYDEHGRPTRMLGTVQDITERRHGEQERAKLKELLHQSQKMKAIGELAAGIAHDFNNLLMVMLGRCEQTKDMLPDQSPALAPLAEAEKAALKARELTDSLLTFSRHMPAKRESLNLCETVQQSCEMIRRMLPTGVSLKLKTCTPPTWMTADSTRLHQLILNLAINARDAMPDGGILSIEVARASESDMGTLKSESQSTGAFACLTVRDTGHGMSPEVVLRALEPFYTTKPRGRGTGLGLSIVHGIVEEHGGSLCIQSEVGKGSLFTVLLPCFQREALLPILDASSSPITSGRGRAVLLISRNSQERALISSMLQAHEYTVVKAESLERGIAHLEASKQHVDLIIISEDGTPTHSLDRLKTVCDNCSMAGVIVIVDDAEDESAEPLAENAMLLHRPFLMSDLARLASFILQGEPRTAENAE